MKAGVLGVVSGEMDEIESFHASQEQDGTTFSRSLQLELEGHTEAGDPVYTGEAAHQTVEEIETVSIDHQSGDIVVAEEPHREGKYTQVIAVPGEFVAVSSGAGEFAFDLIQETAPGVSVSRARLDLTEFADQYYDAPEVNPWQVGFYGNLGEAEKGVVYGDDVFDDSEIGDVLERTQLNQLGLRYEVLGKEVKMTMSDSGYLEVYQPSNFSSVDYANYVMGQILPFASMD